MTNRTAIVVACLVAGLLTACGGGGNDTGGGLAPPTATGTATPDADDVASLLLIDDTVDTAAADRDFTAATDGVALNVGDLVRTDTTGFGQIDYADGSLTRLDADTTVTVASLGTADAPDVDLELDLGRVWNDVRDLGDDGAFRITTDVGVAAVRGTVFVVQCLPDGTCTVTVFDGEVEFTTTTGEVVVVGPGELLGVDADGTPDGPVAVPPGLAAAPWFERNRALDAGDPDPGDLEVTGDFIAPDLFATWDAEWTATEDVFTDSADPNDAFFDNFAGLPTTTGATAAVPFTLNEGSWFLASSTFPLTVGREGPTTFTAGFADVVPVASACDTTTPLTNIVTMEVVGQDGDTPTALAGSYVVSYLAQDAPDGTCTTARITGAWTFTATRRG